MPMTLSNGAAERIAKAQAGARKSAPVGASEHAGAAAAVGAAIREILAAVEAELTEHLALMQDLQDRLTVAELAAQGLALRVADLEAGR